MTPHTTPDRRGIWYLVRNGGRYTHTRYTPEQTRLVKRLRAEGLPLDAIAARTGIVYSSLAYVEALEHCSHVVSGMSAEEGDAP